MGRGEVRQVRELRSEIDDSVNFVWDKGPGQAMEARYVRRHPGYFACYVSCQTACAMACRFCHLTATGQNNPTDVSAQDIITQAGTVLKHYENEFPAQQIHYNFMARGEPLEATAIKSEGDGLFAALQEMAVVHRLLPRILISTIMPQSLEVELTELFPTTHPEIYYSLYTMNPDFRRRWLPRAMDPTKALGMLARWQRFTKKIIRIHHALIEGENDSLNDAVGIVNAVREAELRADFTLVRYNPYSSKHGKESPGYEEYAQVLREQIPGVRVKVIERVGFDVAASCGMFVNDTDGES